MRRQLDFLAIELRPPVAKEAPGGAMAVEEIKIGLKAQQGVR